MKDGTTLCGDRRNSKDIQIPRSRTSLVVIVSSRAIRRVSSIVVFRLKERLCLLTISQTMVKEFFFLSGTLKFVRLHRSVPDSGSFRKPLVDDIWIFFSYVLFVTPRDRNSFQKSFSRLSRYDPKLSDFGLRPIAHSFVPRDKELHGP